MQRIPRQPLVVGLAGSALYLLARGYEGLQHDGVLYSAQALVRGRVPALRADPFFSGGSQDAFSLYSVIVAPLYEFWGLVATHQVLLLIGLIGTAFALLALLRSLSLQTWAPWSLLAVAVLPPLYGGMRVFSYTEPFLTARSLAEPLVILSLTAGVRGRLGLAFALQIAALALHPLMTLPAIALTWLMAVGHDRRWLWAIALAPVLLLLGHLGVSPMDRLLQFYDPVWWALVTGTNKQVVLTNWDLRDWWYVLADAGVLAAAMGLLLPGHRGRRLLAALLAATALLLAASYVGTVLLHSVLITQVQPWRILWLTHLLAAALAPFVLWQLWQKQGLWRLASAFVVLALLDGQSSSGYGGPLLLGGLLSAGLASRGVVVSRAVLNLLLGLCALGIVGYSGAHLLWQLERIDWLQPTAGLVTRLARAATEPLIAVGLVAVLWACASRGPGMQRAALALSAFSLCLAVGIWDRRDDFSRLVESPPPKPPFTELIPSNATVYWPDHLAAIWGLLGRASHYSRHQAAGMLFSQATAQTFAPLRRAYKPIDEARDQCEMGVALGGTRQMLAACATPRMDLLIQLCSQPAHPDFMIFSTPLPLSPLSIWSAPQASFSLYACKQFQQPPIPGPAAP
jgi:hypothetical protein